MNDDRYRERVERLMSIDPETAKLVEWWRSLNRSWARIHSCLAKRMMKFGIGPEED